MILTFLDIQVAKVFQVSRISAQPWKQKYKKNLQMEACYVTKWSWQETSCRPLQATKNLTKRVFDRFVAGGKALTCCCLGVHTWIFLLCVKFLPKFINKNPPKGRIFSYLEDPCIPSGRLKSPTPTSRLLVRFEPH